MDGELLNTELNPLSVGELGEQGLLKLIQPFCSPQPVGDDGALLRVKSDHRLVVTTDILVDGVHFSDRTTPPFSVGWRAMVANLSDLAAMGAYPLGVTVGLSFPGELPVEWVKRFYEGSYQALNIYHTPIIGGDLSRSPTLSVAITALGEVKPENVITRGNAQPGNCLVVTGPHGSSRAGLELLLKPERGQKLSPESKKVLIEAHQKPQARLELLPLLEKLGPVGGMDSSDGLGDAIVQICCKSGVGAVIERESIPLESELFMLTSPEEVWQWVLYGGEDFELVLSLPEKQAHQFIKACQGKSYIIGQFTQEKEVKLVDSQGRFPVEVLTLDRAFQHF